MNIKIFEQKKFIRRITKDFIDLQDSDERNYIEQILSLEILEIKLQELLKQIEIQIQQIQGKLNLITAYKDHEYSFLFEQARKITQTQERIKEKPPCLEIQKKYLKQILEIVEFYIKGSNLKEYWWLEKACIIHSNEYRRPTIDQLLEGTYIRKTKN